MCVALHVLKLSLYCPLNSVPNQTPRCVKFSFISTESLPECQKRLILKKKKKKKRSLKMKRPKQTSKQRNKQNIHTLGSAWRFYLKKKKKKKYKVCSYLTANSAIHIQDNTKWTARCQGPTASCDFCHSAILRVSVHEKQTSGYIKCTDLVIQRHQLNSKYEAYLIFTTDI